MYAYIELSNIARTDSRIQSLSWMSYSPTPLSTLNTSNDVGVHGNTTNNNEVNNQINQLASVQQTVNLHDGWLATGNTNHIVSVTFTSMRSNDQVSLPDRTNFNLRAHRTDVRLVSWNVPFQKLATVDEKGVIFVWVKQENRWSLELINDRSHPVIDMAWSHDGRMTVICYEDGFVLVGSVTGQRYWSTVVNTPQAKISAVTWMPDVSHVILGTTAGNLILMDHHGNTTEGLTLATQPIKQLIYSCNKFYPRSSDNNATKFINDDYVLACSLENGHVLFLNNYQDQSPIDVDTKLQNIKIDWSSPGEILAVGGHKYLVDSSYINQIIFYTRRGEFLHRINIPQTVQPLTALCWAHGDEIVFAACGSYVYTILIQHKALPSMLNLCQMKIKDCLLNNSLQNIEKLILPNNLRENLQNLFRSTIKGFLPDQRTLRSFVCSPLRSHLRLQCTMKRVDNEIDTSSNISTTNLSGATYVLYLEYLGGLIPLLTAKRVSKICPDFIIFDPQMKSTNSMLKNRSSKQTLTSFKSRSKTIHHISSIQEQQSKSSNNNYSNIIPNRNSVHIAENGLQHNIDDLITMKSSSGCSSNNNSDVDEDEELYDERQCHVEEKRSRKKVNNSKSLKHKHSNKLCTIAANIWGTRFKFYGHSNNLPDILGSVTYKTSFLHLQPRQMTVSVASDYVNQKSARPSNQIESDKLFIKNVRKVKQQIRNKTDEEEDDETIALSSSKLNLAGNIPIAPMSPQLQNVRSSLELSDQQTTTFLNETKCSTKIKSTHSGLSRAPFKFNPTTTISNYRNHLPNVDSSAANSSSTSPVNLSRSTSPAVSIPNFIRPISPPCIQVKEPLSPRFSRASSANATNHCINCRHCSPSINFPSVANNIDASTASATTALLIDDSSGYDSSENQYNRANNIVSSAISTVPEYCFEPETYRNLSANNSNQQKKLSLSDPVLNQTTTATTAATKSSHTSQRATTTTTNSDILTSSIPNETQNVQDKNRSDDKIGVVKSANEKILKTKQKNIARKQYSTTRHRMMTCTSGTNDSLTILSASPEAEETSNQNTPSFYTMQNRPPLWNEQSQVYQLDFGGRVTLESAKNFQIEFNGKQVIQFGRIENNCYTLDFEWPFSPLQAFAVALANITQRLK